LRKTNTAIEAIKNIKKDISQKVSKETPVPSAEMEPTDSESDEGITPIVNAMIGDIFSNSSDEKIAADDEEITPAESDVVEVTLSDILANFPDEIVHQRKDGIIQLSLKKKKDAVARQSFVQVVVESGQISINNKVVYESEGKMVNNDTIKIGAFSFKIVIKDGNMQLQPDSATRSLLESANLDEDIGKDGLIRWNIN